MHVYIWAGGQVVRRMHLANYKELMRGSPSVETETLAAEWWPTIDDFESACVAHEEKATRLVNDWRLVMPDPKPAIKK